MQTKYRPEIDGLRALAVIPVVFFHAGFAGFGGGYVGVDVFFVISGYLITSIIASDIERGKFSFAVFYERRARRIFPALFFVVLCCVPFAWIWYPPAEFRDFSQSVAAVSLFSSNVLFWIESGYFDTASEFKPLLHTWSLGVEEQFYVLFPIILLVFWRHARVRLMHVVVVILIASVILSEFWSEQHPSAAFYLLPTRAWELMAGAILALSKGDVRKRVRPLGAESLSIAGLLMIVGSIVLFDHNTRHPALITLIPVLGVVLVIAFSESAQMVRGLLGYKPLVYIGLASYSIYLWHQPVFVFSRVLIGREISVPEYWLLIALSLLFAFISYRMVEQPLRNRNAVSNRQIWALSAVSMIALTTIGSAGHVTDGLPSRFDMKYEFSGRPNLRCMDRTVDDACVIGDRASHPTWAIVGDSHAGALASGLGRRLRDRELSALQLTHAGCSYAPGLRKLGSENADCLTANASVRDYLLNSPISSVVISGRYVLHLEKTRFDNQEGGKERGGDSWYEHVEHVGSEERRELVIAAYREAIRELVSAGKTVFLIYPVPEVGWEVEREMYLREISGEPIELSTDAQLYYRRSEAVIRAFDRLGESPNLIRIRPDEILCNSVQSGRCVTVLDGKVLYRDNNHFSSFGADLVLEQVFASISKHAG